MSSSTCCRSSQGFALHAGKARSAALMASSSCSGVAWGTYVKTSSVAGLMIPWVVGEEVFSPLIMWALMHGT